MAKDWSAALVNVLIDQGRVSLPGLGTFVRSPAAAVIDPIGGKALPPDSAVAFNENLVLDDGRLVQYLRDYYQLNADEAARSVSDYAQGILTRVDAGENVGLPGLGHLRRNYEGKLQFTAGRNRLAKEHFGLPEVALETLTRQETANRRPISAKTPPVTPAKPSPVPPPLPTGATETHYRRRRLVIWLLGATLLLFITGFLIERCTRDSEPDPGPLAGPEAPSLRNDSGDDDAFTRLPTGAPSEDPVGDTDYPPDPAVLPPAEVDDNPPVAPVTTPGYQAVIAIGQFGQADNVNRAENRVRNAGYELYSRRINGLTRVGVEVSYETDAELQRILTEVRRRLAAPDAFVMIKDGRNLLDG